MPALEASLRDVLEFAVETAQLAGAFTLGHYNASTPVEWKSDRSPVTVADRGAEERIRARIDRRFPSHGILGEEFGEKPASAAIADPRGGGGRGAARWILDPIDGTYSFIHGVPLYSTLIGFEFAGEMLAGVIHMPALNETVYAARGLGCFCNGRRARVSDVSDLSHAALLTGGGKLFEKTGRLPLLERMIRACGIHRSWCDGYAYALVATGRAEIVLDPQMNIWDVAAVLPVVTEAGGTLTDWRGQTTHTAGETIATNGRLADAVMGIVNS